MVLDLNMGPTRQRLIAELRRIEPTVVHFHEAWGMGVVPTPCAQIFTVHGFDSENLIADQDRFSRVRSVMWKLTQMRGYGRAKHMISISPYVTGYIRQYSKGAIHEIDNPVDEGFFSVERKEEPGTVLCVGWIGPRKNTMMSVRAFAKSFHAGHARRLIIAGTANDQEYLKSVQDEIARAGLTGVVELVGQINREQLKGHLSRASVLLLPSLQENAPMAVSEAMAVGVPVITSNRCGMPFMVDNNRSGFLIEPTDEAQIVDRLNQLLASADLRGGMSARGREIAMARFHPSKVAQKTMSAYQTIVAERQAARSSLETSRDWRLNNRSTRFPFRIL